jgi:hypothetical protein
VHAPPPATSTLPKATVRETLAVLAGVVMPTVAKGVILRRPRVVAMAATLGLDRRAVRTLQRLLDPRPDDWPLIPFSAGPATCPGRQIVLLLASAWLADSLGGDVRLLPPVRLDPARPLPPTLDNFALRFAAQDR